MILFIFSLCLCVSYFVLLALFSLFFKKEFPSARSVNVLSVALIFILSMLGHIVTMLIADAELANRFQHGFGGGFMAFLVCFLVYRDLKLSISRFEFLFFSLLIVTALGVLNELGELLLQKTTPMIFAIGTYDTWFDLMSNTIGIGLALLLLFPFIPRRQGN